MATSKIEPITGVRKFNIGLIENSKCKKEDKIIYSYIFGNATKLTGARIKNLIRKYQF